MKNKCHILFQYDNHPLTKTNMNAFQFSKSEIQIIYQLTEIMKDFNGIYLVGGNRGTGKTSIVEEAGYQFLRKEKNESSVCICNIHLPLHSNNLCLRILYEISKSDILSQDTKLSKTLQSLITKLENLTSFKDSIVTNSSIKAGISQETNQSNEISVTPALPLPMVSEPILKGNMSKRHSAATNLDKINELQINTTFENEKRYIQEDLLYNFIKFMQDVAKNYKVIVVIDELDKIPKEEILSFLYDNKILLLESDMLFFLICDLQQTIYLESTNIQYFNEIIYLPELSLKEFILVTRQLELSTDIKDALSLFYVTKGNHRDLVHYYMHDRRKQYDSELDAKSLFLAYCVQTEFFTKCPPQYRSILIYFLVKVLDSLQLLGNLDEEELQKIKEEFLLRHSIQTISTSLLLDKFISFLKEPISVPDLSLYHPSWYSNEKEINKIFDQILCKLYSENISLYDNGLFNYALLIDYYKRLNSKKVELEDESFKQISEIIGMNIDIDKLLDNRLLDYLEAFKLSENAFLSEDKVTLVDDHGDGDYTDNAIDKLLLHLPEILGVVIFHPNDEDMVLNNGLIIMDNGIRLIGIPYYGYPGLTSHKSFKFEMFISVLKKYKVFYRTLGDKDFCPDVFADKVYTDKEGIMQVILKNKDYWVEKLLKCRQHS